MEKFDNFGQALAWMMESPENVAFGDAFRTKWKDGKMWFDPGDGTWLESAGNTPGLARMAWSRAPREPLEFRGDAYVCGDLLVYNSERLAQFCNDTNDGTEFELILKEKVK